VAALGRRPFKPDARDYAVRSLKALVEAGEAIPLRWQTDYVFDQGANGTCVAAGILGALDCDDANHVDPNWTNKDIVPFFELIPDHGELPDGGAYVRDGLQTARELYGITYALLRTKADIRDWIENYGPVVVGSDWLAEMNYPDVRGFVTVQGMNIGGHCYYASGDLTGFECVNSWGMWGAAGHFYMSEYDFDLLMGGDFEAWAVVQPALDPVPPTPPEPEPTPPSDSLMDKLIDALTAFVGWLRRLFG
jgi:hypothetical protein